MRFVDVIENSGGFLASAVFLNVIEKQYHKNRVKFIPQNIDIYSGLCYNAGTEFLCTRGGSTMTKRKTLQELTLKDNFMFGAVMCEAQNCKRLLELILEFPIERVEVSREKCIVYHPEYKGIRLPMRRKPSMRLDIKSRLF